MANNDTMSNLLPDSEKMEAKELLAKQGRERSGDIKLVMPQMEEESSPVKKEKLSWRERRKKRKEAKLQAKLRAKGETGSADRSQRKEEMKAQTISSKPELFEDSTFQAQDEGKKASPKMLADDKKKEDQKMKQAENISPVQESPKPMVKGASLSSMGKEVKSEKEKPKEEKQPERSNDSKKRRGAKGGMHQGETLEGFSSPSMNLVPDSVAKEGQGRPSWGIGASFLILILALWVIIGGIGYTRAQKAESALASVNNELTQVNKLIANYASGKEAAQSLQKQLTTVDGLIEEHVYWTLILQQLEGSTIPDVYYTSLNADITLNKLHLRAIAKDYATAARQIRALERSPEFVKSVLVGEARIENQPDAALPIPIVAFDLEIDLVEGVLFLQNPDDLN